MKKIFKSPQFLFGIYFLLALVATVQSYFGSSTFNKIQYTAYNNYIIFKQSFFHLIENKDLYILYPTEHWDLYKYSPTFALLMAPLVIFPNVIGLFFWNAINAFVLFFGIKKIEDVNLQKQKLPSIAFEKFKKQTPVLFGIGGFVLIEMLTSIQNEQSNALIAGLIILAFAWLEKDKIWLGTLCIVLTVYIKIFGIVAFALFLVYPKKGKFILASVVWMLVLGLLPSLFVGMEQLQLQYESWWRMLSEDHAASHGYSVMGWLKTWFGLDVSKNVIVLLGVVLFCLPLVKFKNYTSYKFRWLLLASILLWVVIFNHKAESPTFIIAMSGVGIWYFFNEKNKLNLVLVILAFIFTSLSPTDLFPRFLRESLVKPYVLKAVPCILIWGKIIWEMWNVNKKVSFSKIKTFDLP